MKNKFFYCEIVSFLVILALISGCKKSDANPTTPPSPGQPAAPSITFKGPNTHSTNQYADVAKINASVMSGQMAVLKSVDSLHGIQSGTIWTFTYNAGTYTSTITAEQQTSGNVKWKIVVNGTIDTVTVTNWTAYEGESNTAGKNGSWKLYEVGKATLAADLAWGTNIQSMLTGTLNTYQNTIPKSKIEIANNADSSGGMKIYDLKTATATLYLKIDILWQANGTGTYDVYDEAGNKTSGSWQ
ncbi:MAG: hypothetical protein PHP42_04325 [Bacteroidota bacterium]|nr:hypothetical protein [Bacteroidota bacterium]